MSKLQKNVKNPKNVKDPKNVKNPKNVNDNAFEEINTAVSAI